jgi:hypothetical protein
MTTPEIEIDLPSTLDSASRESDRANWHHRLVLAPGADPLGSPYVEIVTTYGNGVPASIWHGVTLTLANLPDGLADLDPVRAEIRRLTPDLTALLALHRTSWDCRRGATVGGFTDDDAARDLRDRIERRIDEAADQCDRIDA